MTQDECLATPSHYTRFGQCYVGSNVSVQITGLTMGGGTSTSQPVAAPELSVPEPSTLALFACAMLVVASRFARRRRT